MYVANCSLKYNPDYFTVVNKVLTEATQSIDVYTPTYSTGVTAKFDEVVYAEEIGKETTTFTAAVADSVTTWSDGTSTVTMADVGITDIEGTVNGSTIKITYSEGTEPRTALVGDAFIAHHCGGLLLDGGVFDEKKVDGKYVVTLVGETPTDYIKAKCSLLCDADKFEIVDGALSLKTSEGGFDITWDGNIEGKDTVFDAFYKVSDAPLTVEELTGAIGCIIINNNEFSAEIVPVSDSESGSIMIQDEIVGEAPTYQFGLSVLSDTYLEDVLVTKGLYLYRPTEDVYTSRLYKE